MRVIEIFNSIDGEGKRAGLPTTFIRLHGCNLRCGYCDTKYSYDDDFTVMSAEEIVEVCKGYGCKSITITGGEPLIHTGINGLVGMLLEHEFWVNIETNGTCEPLDRDSPFLFYTMDYKLKSSGMTDRVNIEPLLMLSQNDVVKFVVGSVEDMEQALGVIEELRDNAIEMPQVFFSPVFGAIEPEVIVRFLQAHKLWFAKVQLQLHKFIWPPEQRGV